MRDELHEVLEAHQLRSPFADSEGELQCRCGQWIGRRTGGTPDTFREHLVEVIVPTLGAHQEAQREHESAIRALNENLKLRAALADLSSLRSAVARLAEDCKRRGYKDAERLLRKILTDGQGGSERYHVAEVTNPEYAERGKWCVDTGVDVEFFQTREDAQARSDALIKETLQ